MFEHSSELDSIERAIAAELKKNPPSHERQYALPTLEIDAPSVAASGHPLLPYDTDLVSQRSAEAIADEYEAAARAIEAAGAELAERVKQCEALVFNTLSLNEELRTGADRLRREATRISRRIESCSQLTSDVRKVWNDLKTRLESSSRMDQLAE
jgi:hypothetical protein